MRRGYYGSGGRTHHPDIKLCYMDIDTERREFGPVRSNVSGNAAYDQMSLGADAVHWDTASLEALNKVEHRRALRARSVNVVVVLRN